MSGLINRLMRDQSIIAFEFYTICFFISILLTGFKDHFHERFR